MTLPGPLVLTLQLVGFLLAPQTDDWTRERMINVQLDALQESPLGVLEGERVFRFVWLRAHHPPVVIRIAGGNTGGELVLKVGDRPIGFGPSGVIMPRLARSETRRLTPAEWEKLAQAREAGFWHARDRPQPLNVADGSEWLFEGVAHGEYRLVQQWRPEPGPFRDLCVAMLDVAGLDLQNEKVY